MTDYRISIRLSSRDLAVRARDQIEWAMNKTGLIPYHSEIEACDDDALRLALAHITDLHHRTIEGSNKHQTDQPWYECDCRSCKSAVDALGGNEAAVLADGASRLAALPTALVCGNCGSPLDTHCKTHAIPCCPGRCPSGQRDRGV